MIPGTALELPRPPGRWFGRDRELTLTAGEIYGTSGGRTLDFDLTFATGELQAQLTGTTFAVFRTDTASCVCLWEGGIAVTPLVGPAETIDLEVKRRVWVFKDGRAPAILPLSDMEVMKLQMIHEAGLAEAPTADR
jgi:ferric-dicitrate binding protein FerR (iron transport regulator)